MMRNCARFSAPYFLFLLLINPYAVADNVSAFGNAADSSALDDTLKETLVKILPASCHFSGHFDQQKKAQGLDFLIQSNGDFFFSCDIGLVWSASEPFKETLIYINSRNNYQVLGKGDVERMSSAAQYAMSKIFLRVLTGDVDYFIKNFFIRLVGNGMSVELEPKGGLIKKGVKQIFVNKTEHEENGVSLSIAIEDTAGQHTQVSINHIDEYIIPTRSVAYEQCRIVYPSPLEWCDILRSPDNYLNDSDLL